MPNVLPELKAVLPNEACRDAIVFAGRLIKLKNLERLIKAFAKIKENNSKLIIFGQGPEKARLKNLIASLNMGAGVEIKDDVARQELFNIISGCKFFILPSITDVSPNLALECLSLKKPIILTKETGLSADLTKELITVDPLSADDIREKMEFLLEPKNLADYENRLKNLSFKKWDWSEVALAHLHIFKDITK